MLKVRLEGAQRRFYDQLREGYRASLLARVEREGMARSTMHVLEAPLRLRQAACAPVLVDAARAANGSAKLDLLLERLGEVVAEGHKVLVFSQFTSFLALVRDRLTRTDIEHECLDGRTRDRKVHVSRFQDDPACRVFVISLKAGGTGLNLTAASYVFLLDPWWNPAVEAQAIDRSHRLGQVRAVTAYRLIAEDTVEDKDPRAPGSQARVARRPVRRRHRPPGLAHRRGSRDPARAVGVGTLLARARELVDSSLTSSPTCPRSTCNTSGRHGT